MRNVDSSRVEEQVRDRKSSHHLVNFRPRLLLCEIIGTEGERNADHQIIHTTKLMDELNSCIFSVAGTIFNINQVRTRMLSSSWRNLLGGAALNYFYCGKNCSLDMFLTVTCERKK